MLANKRRGAAHLAVPLLVLLVVGLVVALSASKKTISFKPRASEPPVPATPLVSPTPVLSPKPTIIGISPTPTPRPERYVKVITPNGGETLYVGDTYRIKWESSSNINMVTVGYSACPSCLDWIAFNIPNQNYLDWKVSVGNTVNTKFKIYVMGYQTGIGQASDYSDNYFTVFKTLPIITPTPAPPIITTTFIKGGIVGEPYYREVVAKDININDKLTMTASKLPLGIMFSPCRQAIAPKTENTLTCALTGTPLRVGTYKVLFEVKDNTGLKSSKEFDLIFDIANSPSPPVE